MKLNQTCEAFKCLLFHQTENVSTHSRIEVLTVKNEAKLITDQS
uniref:Uncharacterized protein n=1 Tax=Rhizophora mucronata TaxID=61149 RepID=A0A2P2PZ44_RHIMU